MVATSLFSPRLFHLDAAKTLIGNLHGSDCITPVILASKRMIVVFASICVHLLDIRDRYIPGIRDLLFFFCRKRPFSHDDTTPNVDVL